MVKYDEPLFVRELDHLSHQLAELLPIDRGGGFVAMKLSNQEVLGLIPGWWVFHPGVICILI